MIFRSSRIFSAFIALIIGLSIAPSEGLGWHFFKRADFSTVVFVGDSLTAGFQNGGLGEDGQVNGYAAQLARQAGFDITLPIVSEPGLPPKFALISIDPLQIVRQPVDPADPPVRTNPGVQATNLGVPGQKVFDALFRKPTWPPPDDQLDAITSVVLGLPGAFSTPPLLLSQVEWAEALAPTFIFLWIGNNDVLGFATSGGTEPLTPIDDLEDQYTDLLDRLEHTGADLVIANIPDVAAIPFFFPAEQIAAQVGQDLAVIGPLLGIESGDFVTLEGLPLVEQKLVEWSIWEHPDPMPEPLPDNVVLDADEVVQVQQAIDQLNTLIARQSYRRNIPLVNINRLFKFIKLFGVPANGKLLTADYLGGLFSLDGIHPTVTGYAVVANHFIRTLNFRYKARIRRININEVAADDPLVKPELLPDLRDIFKDIFKSRNSGVMR